MNYKDRLLNIPETMNNNPINPVALEENKEYLENAILKYYNEANGDVKHDKKIAKEIGNELKEIQKLQNGSKYRQRNELSERLDTT